MMDAEQKNTNTVSDQLVTVCMDLLSNGLAADTWTPNEFTTYLMMTGVFRAERDVVQSSSVLKLNPVTMFCISKWLTERVVSRNVAYYLAVIARYYLKEQSQHIGVDEGVIANFQKISESAYNYSLKMGSTTTIPVPNAL